MSLKYQKSKDDDRMEKRDLRYSPIMCYIKNQEVLRFNVGDILIKQSRYGDQEWKTDTTPIGAPKKYMYVFENELGVGYIKQLKVDGTGFTSHLQCVANFDCEYTRLVLDPDFVDHLLIGGDEFQYNTEHALKKQFRQEAMTNNRKICLNVKTKQVWLEEQVKAGDRFWCGNSFQQLIDMSYEVVGVAREKNDKGKITSVNITVKDKHGRTQYWSEQNIRYAKLTLSEPFPLEDELCGRQR